MKSGVEINEDDDTNDFLTPAERQDYVSRGVPDYGDY